MRLLLYTLGCFGFILLCSMAYVWATPEQPKEQCVPIYAQSGLECCQ